MASLLFFLAGALAAVVAMMVVGQRKTRTLTDRISLLSSENSAKQREAEMLARQIEDGKQEHERLLEEARRQICYCADQPLG